MPWSGTPYTVNPPLVTAVTLPTHILVTITAREPPTLKPGMSAKRNEMVAGRPAVSSAPVAVAAATFVVKRYRSFRRLPS